MYAEDLTARKLRRNALETNFRSRIVAKQIWWLRFSLTGQKKLATLPLAISVGLHHRFRFEIAQARKARRRLLRDQVAALAVRDYARLRSAPSHEKGGAETARQS
jgi:hypothetical protein